MKKIILLLSLFFCSALQAQNLVNNPSFEDYTTCPTGWAEIANAVGWSSFSQSCDYYNSCGSSSFSTPSNITGYQYPHTGNAYAGIIIFDRAGFYREAIGSQLSSPLIIGQKYYVSFYANLTLEPPNSTFAANKLGAKFTTVAYNEYSNPIPIDNTAQLHCDSIITDTANWSVVSSVFFF